MLTFDPQRKLITDGFTFAVKGATGVISAGASRDLLKHQALIRSNYSGRCIVR